MRPLTVAGWDTVSDSVHPPKPVAGDSEAHLSAQAEGGGVEAVGARGVGHLQGDGFDGIHDGHARSGSVTGASRFLIDWSPVPPGTTVSTGPPS